MPKDGGGMRLVAPARRFIYTHLRGRKPRRLHISGSASGFIPAAAAEV